MTPERWQHIKALLHSALERKPEERAAFLSEACGDDKDLREDLQSLLAHEEQAGSFIEQPAFGVMAETLAKEKPPTMLGRTLGRYRIIDILGSGGMGEVYVAEDTQLGRKIALKTLPAHFTIDDERVRRFQREARAASALNHPNIITIYEMGQIESHPFIVTEFIEGETLRQHMAKRKMTISEALDVAMQVASALATAHHAGIVHRDIKPENIMLRADGIAKVLDFGLVKLTERKNVTSESSTLFETAQGMVMGTVHYMSPEQARGLAVDSRTDIWSLGAVLYEMVGARLPFEGATSSDVIAAILEREPTTLTRYSPEAPAELEWIVKKALRKDRQERYQTAKELLSDLKGLKRRLEFEQDLERSADSGRQNVDLSRSSDSKATRAPGQSHGTHSHQVIDSLAILPLVNNCADPNMEYLSDGITESMISSLSQLAELRVMAWSTVSRYKSKEVDPRELGRDLGVQAVLTGRVLQPGKRLVIKTELVNAMDGSHLWGESYSCEPSDILDIEAEISRAISEKLLVRLTAEERKQLTRRYPDNVEAYHAYLKGRYFWNKRSEEGLKKGIEQFEQAIEKDPNYALAYTGLADCYLMLGRFGVVPPKETMAKAKAAVTKALEIDDQLAEAHTSLAFIRQNYDWNFPGAKTEFKRAIELNPNHATAHFWYAIFLAETAGPRDEAMTEIKRAQELDPLSLIISTDIGMILYLTRRYDEAIEQCRKTLELDPNFFRARLWLGRSFERKGMYWEAIAEFQRARQLDDKPFVLAWLGHAYAAAGKRNDARKVLDELKQVSKQMYVDSYYMAAIYVALGEKDQAFESLEKAYEERSTWLSRLKVDPIFEGLHSDPRFRDLVRRMGLPLVESIQPAKPSSERQRTDTAKEPVADLSKLAILPLVNASPDSNLEYLSDGITESIINSLSQLRHIRVMARSSVFRYKGKDVSPQEVGRELGVRAVLTGRVLQVGERLVVGAELVDTTDETQLWGKHYSRNLSDIFEVQEEIAHEISEALRLRLTGKEQERLAKRHTESTEAYQLYLKGLHFFNKRSVEGYNKAIEYYQQAIEKDPNYALAYAGLADCYANCSVAELLPKDAIVKARAAATRALEIDDTLGEAHNALGHLQLNLEWEWSAAERAFKRALELNPNYAEAHHRYSHYLVAMGRFEESLIESLKGLELDPIDLTMNTHLGWHYLMARQHDQAIEQLKKTLELDQSFVRAHLYLGQAYERTGLYPEAIEEIQKVTTRYGQSQIATGLLGHAYAAAGKRYEAEKLIKELEMLSKREHVWPYNMAVIWMGLGEKERTLECLEKAYENRSEDLIYLNVELMFDSLRSDPRFQDLLVRVGLPRIETSEPTTLASDAETSLTHYLQSPSWWHRPEIKTVLAPVIVLIAGLAFWLLWPSRETSPPAPLRSATFTQLTDQPGPEFFPSLSPDAKSLAYASRASGNWDIYLQRVGQRNPINLTKDSTADDTQPAFSPDGDRIAFRSEREGGGIFLMGVTGESVVRVADFGYSPAWSPDGKQILVGTEKIPQPSTRPSKSQLWTINTRTNERRLITEGDALQPNCSPQGNRIAFWSRPSKIGQRDSIWTISIEGGDPVPVTDGTTTDSNPAWSPDGKFLYFSSNRGGSVNIWRVAIDEKSGAVSGQPQAVTTIGAAASALQLSLARDGRQLVYIAQEEVRNLRKISFDPASGKSLGDPASITRGSMQLWFPDASPDGEWLTCYSMGNQRHIFVMRTDGSELRDLTDDSFRHFWPRWSPDGKRIAFSSRRSGNYEIWAINPDGSGLKQLTSGHESPGAHYSPWSPDGNRIAYSIHTPRNECIIFEPGKSWAEQKLTYLPPLGDASLSFEGWSWSPDGKKLAGIRHLPSGVHSGIGFYDLESKDYEWLTDFGDWPLWFNDNRHLLFVSQGEILLFDTLTRKHQQILKVTDQDVDIGSCALSPDNRTIYFTYVAAEADIWLMTLE